MPALTKETYTGEAHLKEQLEILRKYVYNVAQRHPEENREQQLERVPFAVTTMGNLVDEVIKQRGKECDALNAKYGDS